MCQKNTIIVSIITSVTQKMHKTDLYQYTAYLQWSTIKLPQLSIPGNDQLTVTNWDNRNMNSQMYKINIKYSCTLINTANILHGKRVYHYTWTFSFTKCHKCTLNKPREKYYIFQGWWQCSVRHKSVTTGGWSKVCCVSDVVVRTILFTQISNFRFHIYAVLKLSFWELAHCSIWRDAFKLTANRYCMS